MYDVVSESEITSCNKFDKPLGYTPLNIDKAWPRLLWGEHLVNIIRWMTSSVNHACSLFCSIKTDQPMSVTIRHI